MSKPKVAFYWCASCGGCEEAIVDFHEGILDVVAAVDIIFWPVAMDFKIKDVEAMPDKSITVSFINGAIRTSEQEEMAKMLRRKSQFVISFGSCSHLGGIPGLANFNNRKEVFETAYLKSPSTDNPKGTLPQTSTKIDQGDLSLPEFYDTVKTLDQTIDVDYYIPGCAPNPELTKNAIGALLKGELPPKGSVLAPKKALCDTCPRKETKPDKMIMDKIRRPHEVIADPEKCFLVQGLICMGPATRTGCGEPCIRGNMPCRGCTGPVEGVGDQGGKMISALASILGVENESAMSDEDVQKLIEQIPDLAGTIYRFSLPASLLHRKRS